MIERLRKPREFRRIYGQGRCYVGRCAKLYVISGPRDTTKVGFSVGKRVGNAVERNRIRRLMREAYRDLAGQVRDGAEVVFLGRRAALDAGFWGVRRCMEDLLKQSGLILEEKSCRTGRDGSGESGGG